MAAHAAVIAGSLWFCTVVSAQSGEKLFEYSVDTPQAKAVAAAKEAVQKKQWDLLPVLAAKAEGDVLKIYVDYWIAQQEVKQAKSTQNIPVAEKFLAKYPGSYMADKLKADWVLEAAEHGDFKTILALGDFPWQNKQVRCAKLEARHMMVARAKPTEALEAFSPGKACWSLMDQLVADGVIGRKELVPLLQEAVENNQTATASRFASYLFNPPDQQAFVSMLSDPGKWLRSQQGKMTQDRALIAAAALVLAGRKDADAALHNLQHNWKSRLPGGLYSWAIAQFALRKSLNHDLSADKLYRQAGMIPLSDTNYEWRVRAALRQPKIDWAWVQKTIEAMPAHLQNDPAWQYWKGRALAGQGKDGEARKIYEAVAADFGFYGQLAKEELGQAIVIPPSPEPVTNQELQQARDNPHLRQAVALFRQGWRAEAVPQWNFGLRGMTDRQLLAAAEFAREQRIYDRVVNTSERTNEVTDFSQRFIAPFEEPVVRQSKSINLDPAWVYGLIRQESRFIMDARSVVGASGLMQLMPGTAKLVAKKIGMKDFKLSQINDFDTNILLGTNYLSMVRQNLDGSEILATAGYNAGPGRAVKWRSTLTHPVEGAIFAETIPFNETRQYVKNVLSNATYYANRFTGEPQSLKQRLGMVVPVR